jgi:branched-chain amino acid transport system permease protein
VIAKAAGALAVAALIALPPLLPKYHLEVLISVLFWAYLGIAWNLLGGYAGQFSFGHAAFFGIGAYTSTLLLLQVGLTPWVGMILGGGLAAAFGLFEGYLSFRYGLKGPYFSLVTLAVGSSLGLVVPSAKAAPAMFMFSGKLPYYYIILAMGALALALTWKIGRSRLGFSLAAVRENEDAAETAGVDALATKLRAMALSSFLTALGGTFYAQYFAYIDPTISFGPSVSIGALLPAIVGGAGTVLGPVLGSFVLTPLSELTRYALRGRAGADIMLYGAILVLVISFLPQGIVGLVGERRARAGRR